MRKITTRKKKQQANKSGLLKTLLHGLMVCGVVIFLNACDQGTPEEEIGPISGRSFQTEDVEPVAKATFKAEEVKLLDVAPEVEPEIDETPPDAAADHQAISAQEPEAEPGAPPLLSFAVLANFTFEVHWGKTKEQLPKQIPDEVLAWNGKMVRTAGFMVPLDITKSGQIKSFYLIRDTGNCCFNGKPALNNMIVVTVKPGVKCQYIAYSPLEIRGKIEIGEEVKFKRVVSVYRMTAEKVRYTEVD